MHRREAIKALGLTGVGIGLGGCLPIKMAGRPSGLGASYVEVIETVLMSQDLKHLAVIGATYDYIFQDASELTQLIQSPIHEHLSADFSGFAIGAGNSVRGTLLLSLDSADNKIQKEAERLGFLINLNGDLALQLTMQGVRYKKNQEAPVGESYRLNRRYAVPVTVPASVAPEKLASAPLRLAAGGALLLIAIPVFVLYALVRPKK